MNWIMALFSRWPVRKRVLVSLRNGSAMDGILMRKSGPLLTLVDCTLRETEAEPVKMDGQVIIERCTVLFIQTTI